MRMTKRMNSSPGRRFLRSLRIRSEPSKMILTRLFQGDRLIFYPIVIGGLRDRALAARLVLHSENPQERVSIEVSTHTAKALVIRGLIYEDKDDSGKFIYKLTEDGEVAAKILENKYEEEWV